MTDSEKLDRLLMQMQGVKENVQGLKENVQGMQEDVQNLQKKTDILDIRVTKVELTLENEIRVNIQRVAEGHLDLSRNLHEAMRPSNEVEMLAIKVRMLETDIRGLKARLA